MAAAAFNIIGIMFGVVSMVPMLESMMPDQSDRQTTVRIGAGTSIYGSAETKGNVPGVRIFDAMGRDIGYQRGSSGTIKDGSKADVVITATEEVGARQAHYISISKGGNDALCISYIAVTWPDGQKKAWYGDVGYQCGAFWYNSQTTIGELDYKPKCIWIDGNETNGITTQGVGIHLTDFTATEERAQAYAENPELMCGSKPRFYLYENLTTDFAIPHFDPPLEFDENLVDLDPSKVLQPGSTTTGLPAAPDNKPSNVERRAVEARRHTFTGKLITSPANAHSAKELCESPNSLGPDFVSFHEGLFCDMSEKELWPLCKSNIQTGCFDAKANIMRAGSLSRRDEDSGRIIPEKDYVDVQSW